MNEEKNKKVCLVSISLGMGGVERSVALQSKMLEQVGFEVHLAILNDQIVYDYAGQLLNLGQLKSGGDNLLKRIQRLKHLRHYLKENKIDVVIDHRSKNQYLREVFYKKLVYRGIKTVYVTHSSHAPMYLTEKPEAFVKLCNGNLANVAVSEYIEKERLQANGMSQTHTIYNTWDPQWEQDSGSLPAVLKDKTYYLFYGRMNDTVKDLKFFMQAFADSELGKKGIHLVFMGEGPDSEMLKSFAMETAISQSIIWLPFIKNPQEIVRRAHAVCLTSRFEGFPMVLVESLALDTPVVSLDIVSGPSEIVQNEQNGLLVTERDTKAFANALVLLVENEKLYRTCKSNAKASVASFSPETIGLQWKNLLQHV